MIHKVSTDVLDHIILFHDKSRILVNEKQAMAIDQALNFGQASHIRLNGQTYSKGSISKIMVLGEFYSQYPDLKPKEYQDITSLMHEQGFIEKPVTQEQIIKGASDKGLKEMMKDFLKYGKESSPIYQLMKARLEGKPNPLSGEEYKPKFSGDNAWKNAKAAGVI